jgi:hypothetical protein
LRLRYARVRGSHDRQRREGLCISLMSFLWPAPTAIWSLPEFVTRSNHLHDLVAAGVQGDSPTHSVQARQIATNALALLGPGFELMSPLISDSKGFRQLGTWRLSLGEPRMHECSRCSDGARQPLRPTGTGKETRVCLRQPDLGSRHPRQYEDRKRARTRRHRPGLCPRWTQLPALACSRTAPWLCRRSRRRWRSRATGDQRRGGKFTPSASRSDRCGFQTPPLPFREERRKLLIGRIRDPR